MAIPGATTIVRITAQGDLVWAQGDDRWLNHRHDDRDSTLCTMRFSDLRHCSDGSIIAKSGKLWWEVARDHRLHLITVAEAERRIALPPSPQWPFGLMGDPY